MAIIDQFRLKSATQKREISPIDRFRRRMTSAIEQQIEIAIADLANQPLNKTRQRWVKVGASGEKELRSVPVRPKRWWWKDAQGITFVTLKYGSKPLEITPGHPVIEIGEEKDLPNKLSLLLDAVRAGELDRCASFAAHGLDRATQKEANTSSKVKTSRSKMEAC